MQDQLHEIFQLIWEQPALPSLERYTAIERVRQAEQALSARLDPAAAALWETWQDRDGALAQLDAEQCFRRALALGMALGRL